MTAAAFNIEGALRAIVREEMRATFALFDSNTTGELRDGYWDGSLSARDVLDGIESQRQKWRDEHADDIAAAKARQAGAR